MRRELKALVISGELLIIVSLALVISGLAMNGLSSSLGELSHLLNSQENPHAERLRFHPPPLRSRDFGPCGSPRENHKK
ncbi:hypothetical protein [Thermococcus stetteri]|uniref:hypothetical protein n=1 Tax=Thermococcus stetteri TaxID=49900 RepID=UPI001AE83ED9|nr:hypothetical protein [Thermococcus stetteri]MBP1912816.1 hypothetical protein [Thermococcus stetteri]